MPSDRGEPFVEDLLYDSLRYLPAPQECQGALEFHVNGNDCALGNCLGLFDRRKAKLERPIIDCRCDQAFDTTAFWTKSLLLGDDNGRSWNAFFGVILAFYYEVTCVARFIRGVERRTDSVILG